MSMRPRATCCTVSCSLPSCEARKGWILISPLLSSSTALAKRSICIAQGLPFGGAPLV